MMFKNALLLLAATTICATASGEAHNSDHPYPRIVYHPRPLRLDPSLLSGDPSQHSQAHRRSMNSGPLDHAKVNELLYHLDQITRLSGELRSAISGNGVAYNQQHIPSAEVNAQAPHLKHHASGPQTGYVNGKKPFVRVYEGRRDPSQYRPVSKSDSKPSLPYTQSTVSRAGSRLKKY
ncbi:hypothetical protein GGI12_005038 [Dipsacomyces acuminosporus]|nr:hypothetical protein GGI12_005038 [Dipsacomyces acuminosporus]